MSPSLKASIVFALALALVASSASAGQPSANCDEPNVQTALRWWTPQQNVWTPIGWKEHLWAAAPPLEVAQFHA